MLLLNSSISLSPATTESPKLLPLSSGCWQEKSWSSEELSSKTRNGKNSSIYSLLVTWKPSEANKNNLEEKSRKPTDKKQAKSKLKNNLNKAQLKSKMKIGDLYEI